MTWKPESPWQIIARRGQGDAFVSATYTAPTYWAALVLRNRMMRAPRPYGVPPWDSIEVRETLVAARVKKPLIPAKPGKAASRSGILPGLE